MDVDVGLAWITVLGLSSVWVGWCWAGFESYCRFGCGWLCVGLVSFALERIKLAGGLGFGCLGLALVGSVELDWLSVVCLDWFWLGFCLVGLAAWLGSASGVANLVLKQCSLDKNATCAH